MNSSKNVLCVVLALAVMIMATTVVTAAERTEQPKVPGPMPTDPNALTISPNDNAAELMDALVVPGTGITITSVTLEGAATASGTYTGGPFSMGSGIVLASGAVTNALPPNSGGGIGTNFYLPGCDECNAIIPGYTSYDAVILTIVFDVTPACSSITFDFVFGSEEYPEYVGTSYNDVFGAYLNGTQVAFDSEGNPITINGPFFSSGNVQVPPTNGMEYDGSTAKLKTIASITPGSTGNVLKIVVCDAGDHILDSGVLLRALQGSAIDTVVTGFPPEFVSTGDINCSDTIYTAPGATVQFTVQAVDNGPNDDNVRLSVTGLPSGATMTPPLPMWGNPAVSEFSWIPADGQAGTYPIQFVALDSLDGVTEVCNYTIIVEDTLGCYPDLPDPEIVMLDCITPAASPKLTDFHDLQLSNTAATYCLNVINWDVYPDILFEPAPEFEPCDDQTSARTIVEIYSSDGVLLNLFCDFDEAADLEIICFDIPDGEEVPDSVYVVITDQQCELSYISETISTGDAVQTAPNIDCPSGPLKIDLAGPDTVCIEVPITGADDVFVSGAVWADDTLCFYAADEGVYPFEVTAENQCGISNCEFSVVISMDTAFEPTNEWINVFCAEPAVNGEPLMPGDIIKAYDPDGVMCGIDTVKEDGSFGFMPVYAEEPYNPGDQGAEPGNLITFKVNDVEYQTDPEVFWTSNGDMVEVCDFFNCQPFELQAGWHLISWNQQYSGSVEDFLSLLGEGASCVEVILSFDQGGLTYDPDLLEFSTLWDVDYHFGYWIKLNCPVEFDICGGKIDPEQQIDLFQYWNLVSYWPQDSLPISDALTDTYSELIVALGFDGAGLSHTPGEDAFNTLTHMGPGFGYWLKVNNPGALIYPGWNGIDQPVARSLAEYDIEPSRQWVSLYGSNLTLDGKPLANSVIEVFDANGTRCGRGVYVDGLLRFTPVYGHDASSEVTAAYPEAGDKLTLTVNGTPVETNLIWTTQGDRIQIGPLASGGQPVEKPTTYRLHQNYPNPFNPSTTISFESAMAADYTLTVYNTLGQVVTHFEGTAQPGENKVVWDASAASSGVYLYKLDIGQFTDTKKMLLMK